MSHYYDGATAATADVQPAGASNGDDEGVIEWWYPSLQRVAARLAQPVLREDDEWREADFFQTLGRRHPLLAGLGVDQLAGEVLVVDDKHLIRLCHEELPFDGLLRLKALLAKKPRMSRAELEGFLGPIGLGGKHLPDFLGKYCREHRDHAGKGLPNTYSLA